MTIVFEFLRRSKPTSVSLLFQQCRKLKFFFQMVFQQNCTQGHSGHMIKIYVLFFSSLLRELCCFYFYVMSEANLLVVLLSLLLFFFFCIPSSALLWHDLVLLVPCSFYRNNKKVRSIKSS